MGAEHSASLSDFRVAAQEFLAVHGLRATAESALLEGSRAPAVVAAEKALQAKIFDAGFSGITWPREYGGRGLPEEYQRAWAEACSGYVMPSIFRMSFGMCGPTLLDLGTTAQKERYIRPLLRGEEVWCQLFSEPGAGSDVAGLSTRAEAVDDGWRISGQKLWTSGAHIADFGILIARTDPTVPKHQGITMFVLDMHAPGVTVRPLRVMTGDSSFTEVFLDDVLLPHDAVVGEVGAGWRNALLMLGHERIALGLAARPQALSYRQVLATAREHGVADVPVVQDQLAALYALETSATLLSSRLRQEKDAGRDIGARGSIAKLAGSFVGRWAVDVADEVAGAHMAFWEEGRDWSPVTRGVVEAPASGIAGGTNEIQRSLIGERVLGLPREPVLDRDVPFRDLVKGRRT